MEGDPEQSKKEISGSAIETTDMSASSLSQQDDISASGTA